MEFDTNIRMKPTVAHVENSGFYPVGQSGYTCLALQSFIKFCGWSTFLHACLPAASPEYKYIKCMTVNQIRAMTGRYCNT